MTSLPTKIVYCKRSGLPLLSVSPLIGAAGWPLIQELHDDIIHPVYDIPLSGLLTRLRDELNIADEASWLIEEQLFKSIRLHMSAIMYSLGVIWQPPRETIHLWHKLEPSLPSEAVAAGSASRLFKVARWYHYATSKRMELPVYRVSRANNNINWENFSAWLDDAFSVRKEWESGRQELQRQDQLRLQSEALREIRNADVYKRLDFRKVWYWVDLQLMVDPTYPAGRRATFKEVFTTADTKPELWALDDLEDLQEAIIKCCDRENDVYFFVNQRIIRLREAIKSFYGSFTLLDSDVADDPAASEREKILTAQFFSPYDQQASEITELPPEPQRHQYPTLPKYLQAAAQWRLLRARFNKQQDQKGGV